MLGAMVWMAQKRSTFTHVFNNMCRGAGAAPVYEPFDGRASGSIIATFPATVVSLSHIVLCVQSRIQASPSSTSLLARFCLVTAGEVTEILRLHDSTITLLATTSSQQVLTSDDHFNHPLQQSPLATLSTTAPSDPPVQQNDTVIP